MNNYSCHFCELHYRMIILVGKDRLCPRCFKNLYLVEPIFIDDLQSRIDLVVDFDSDDPIEKITAQLIAHFIGKGMSIVKISRQLGMTRATIYARIKKYNLIDTKPRLPMKVHITEADAHASGKFTRKNCKVSFADDRLETEVTTPVLDFDPDGEYLKC